MRKLALFLALTAGALMPITALAQDSSSSSSKKKRSKSKKSTNKVKKQPEEEIVEVPPAQSFSNEQIMLNNQAVVATKEQNYEKAEQLFNAMLQIGEFNIIWMNLGRTYTSQNKCIEAADAFSRVATAPPIADFPPEVINEKTEGYIKDLNDQCSSSVILNCDPEDALITIDGGMERVCSPEPIKLVPGRHAIYAKTSYGFNTVVVDTTAFETSTVDVAVVDYEQVISDAGITLEVLNKKSKLFKAIGYSFIGVGAAVIGGGFGLMGYAWFVHYPGNTDRHLVPDGQDPNEFAKERQKVTQKYLNGSYGMVAAGGAILATGIALVIIDAVNYVPQIKALEASDRLSSTDFHFSPVFSPEFAGMNFGFTF